MSGSQSYHEEEILGKAYDARLMKRLLTYVRPYRWVIVLAVLSLLLSALFQTSLAFITKQGIDNYILKGNADGFHGIALAYELCRDLLDLVGRTACSARYTYEDFPPPPESAPWVF